MNKTKLMFALLASLVLGACSSDSGDDAVYTVTEVTEAPVWQMDFSGSENRPNWQEPNPASYENWTIMLVQLEEELRAYTSGEDLMALFIGGELRGLTSPALSSDAADKGTFILKAYGNEGDQNIVNLTLKYYCSQLKQTFSRTVQMRYDMGKVYGLEENIVPQFTLGSDKYPVVKTININAIIAAASIEPAQGDYFAAFFGEECRGIGNGTTMLLYGREEGESVTLKYYQAATGKVYTFPDAVQIK